MSDRYELTLAGPAGDEAVRTRPGANGVFYKFGAEVDAELRDHPLAKAERGRPKGHDHIHLSVIDGTDFIRWMGRRANGYHYQIGRVMKLASPAPNQAAGG